MLTKHVLGTIVLLAIMILSAQQAKATRQEGDLLILEGARYYTHKLPSLEQCLPGVPIPKFKMLSTANYKGFRATWAIINSRLFLIGVEGKTRASKKEKMLSTPEIFPKVPFPFKVTAFSGTIELKGRGFDYEINGNTITYTDKLVLELKKGRVTKVSRTTHDEKLK